VVERHDEQFRLEEHDGIRVVRVRGEIDLDNAAVFRQVVESNRPPGPVVVDLADVTYIDSAGIHVIDRAASTLAAREQPLRIVAPPNSRAAWAFRVAGFVGHTFADSLEAARFSILE
jgi:anti-anti-sigma factor